MSGPNPPARLLDVEAAGVVGMGTDRVVPRGGLGLERLEPPHQSLLNKLRDHGIPKRTQRLFLLQAALRVGLADVEAHHGTAGPAVGESEGRARRVAGP